MLKKFLAMLLLAATPVFAQVNSDQIKKKTNGGLVGDTSKALAVAPYRGTSAPSSPVTGQLWADTTYTPPTLKMWNGSAWEATQTMDAMPVQGNADTFPGSPVDGQLFWSTSNSTAYIYDATNAVWRRLADGRLASGTYRLPTTASTIADPTTAPTLSFVTGSSMASNGTHVCVYTWVNSTGGETLPSATSASATATTGTTSWSLSGVLTGPTGTTKRRVYCSKAGTITPLYWTGEIADNTSTTAAFTTTEASLVQPAPSFNYSAALPSGWSCAHCADDSGGCGCASDGAVGCKVQRTFTYSATADSTARAYRALGFSGSFTVEARVVGAGWTITTPAADSLTRGILFARAGTADGDIGFGPVVNNTNLSATNWAGQRTNYRTTAGGSITGLNSQLMAFPGTSTYPFWVKMACDESGATPAVMTFASRDRDLWTPTTVGSSVANTYITINSAPTYLEVWPYTTTNTAQGEIRVDSILVRTISP